MSDPDSDKDKSNGSLLVVEAESAAAVRAILEKDLFWTNNVVSPSIDPSVLLLLPLVVFLLLKPLFLILFLCLVWRLLMGLSSWRRKSCHGQWDKEKLEIRSITVLLNEP